MSDDNTTQEIPQASDGMPEAGLQLDMDGKTRRVQPASRARYTTMSMDDYARLLEQRGADNGNRDQTEA